MRIRLSPLAHAHDKKQKNKKQKTKNKKQKTKNKKQKTKNKKQKTKKKTSYEIIIKIMLNLNRNTFQAHPFHVVSPSTWPLYTSISLLSLTPALILVLIAFPSFKLLYLMDEVTDPSLSVLAEGHQWYWSYEYPDFLNSDGDFVEFDSYLVPQSHLEGTFIMLDVYNTLVGIVESWSLFTPIHCSSPSKVNEAFQNLEVVVKPQLKEVKGIVTHTAPDMDFSSIDRMLAELKNNMSFMTDSRISNLEAEIAGNIAQLRKVADDTFKNCGLQIFYVITLFYDLSRLSDFKDLEPIMNKVAEMVNQDTPKPAKSLLNSDPVKYWVDSVGYANKQQNKTTHMLKLFKDYVKYNGVLESEDKTIIFTAIKNLNKTASNVADTDKLIFRKNIESSKILMELKNKGKI
jgi:hypothetical protein